MNKKRISIVTSGHPPFDDRIFWKFGKSLTEAGFLITIISSTEGTNKSVDGINIIGFIDSGMRKNEKINQFVKIISEVKPDLIICEEMIPAFGALKYKSRNNTVKIIFDITEWYPENVSLKYKGFKKIFKYVQLLFPYIFVLNLMDYLIVGEKTKLRRYKIIAPLTHKTIIGYYPVLKYFNYKKPEVNRDKIILGYAGVITFERGIIELLKVCENLSDLYKEKKFKLLLFGKFTYHEEENYFLEIINSVKNFEIEFVSWVNYNQMSSVIERMDICFDLRKQNFIYRNSLPIKIFEYMACGKPFIFSDIEPIRKELDYKYFGFLVNPQNKNEIIDSVKAYIENPELLQKQSLQARDFIEKEKNWENESKKLLRLVDDILS